MWKGAIAPLWPRGCHIPGIKDIKSKGHQIIGHQSITMYMSVLSQYLKSIIGNVRIKNLEFQESKGHKELNSCGRAARPVWWVLLAAMALLMLGADGHEAGQVHPRAPGPYEIVQHKRCVHNYTKYMRDNNFIKKHEVVRHHIKGHKKLWKLLRLM